MELFNELKNNSLQAAVRTINTIHRTNQPISKPELEKRITNNSSLSPQEQKLIDNLFVPDAANTELLRPFAKQAVPIIPTILEIKWLKEMLHDHRIDCLISASLKEKLLHNGYTAGHAPGWQQRATLAAIKLEHQHSNRQALLSLRSLSGEI